MAPQCCILSLQYCTFAYTFLLIFFYLKHAVNNKKMWYTEIRLVSFFVSTCQHYTFFAHGDLCYLFFVVRNIAVPFCSNVKWCPIWPLSFCTQCTLCCGKPFSHLIRINCRYLQLIADISN